MTSYNVGVQPKTYIRMFLLFILLAGLIKPPASVRAVPIAERPAAADVTAFDLIIAMNTLRMSYGLPALIEDPIINAVAQNTAQIMAANRSSWHIGNVSGRIQSAGYGGGAKVWATENFAVGYNSPIDEIMIAWSDESHMYPAVNPAYCNVGAGTAKAANGMTYYVLQAAYVSGKSCGSYTTGGGTAPGGGTTPGGNNPPGGQTGVSQIIVPVKIAEPDADGKIIHVVQAGQSFWAIAVAYKITIRDLEIWNNLTSASRLQIGQKLFIPGKDTDGYATPTPVGMVEVHPPDQQGRIVHEVKSHQALSTIAQAYSVTIDTILALNGIQADWPLQIDQKLLIHPGNVTPSPTPRPLTPVEKLTPESDGVYYHSVGSGENLSWIADLYEITVADLMAWNGLNANSILRPDQKLVLQVTPPATATHTPGPPTATPPPTAVPPTATASLTPTQAETLPDPTAPVSSAAAAGPAPALWFIPVGLIAGGLFVFVFFSRKRR